MLTCVLLHPFCFYGLDSSLPLIALEGKRARYVNPVARALGVEAGMLETAVRFKAPDAQLVLVPNPNTLERWSTLLESLYILSPNVEGSREGIAFLTVRSSDALHLAGVYGARLGRGETQELALLAAQGAEEGKVLSWPKPGPGRSRWPVDSAGNSSSVARCSLSSRQHPSRRVEHADGHVVGIVLGRTGEGGTGPPACGHPAGDPLKVGVHGLI